MCKERKRKREGGRAQSRVGGSPSCEWATGSPNLQGAGAPGTRSRRPARGLSRFCPKPGLGRGARPRPRARRAACPPSPGARAGRARLTHRQLNPSADLEDSARKRQTKCNHGNSQSRGRGTGFSYRCPSGTNYLFPKLERTLRLRSWIRSLGRF